MKRLFALIAASAALIGLPQSSSAQDFGGNRTTELKEVTAAELPKPPIPDIDVGDPQPPGPVVRPVYLVYRYYSCAPWYPFYVKNVFTNAVSRKLYRVEIDTAGAVSPGDNVDGQIVTDINHPAYGLYCITIRLCIPWNTWVAGKFSRFYIRWAYQAPFWCWHDHWWYYWQRPFVNVTLNANQEVPPNTSSATATAVVRLLDPANVAYTLTWNGLTGAPTGAHFHAPAPPGTNAGVLVPITLPAGAGTSGTVSGTTNNQQLIAFLSQPSPAPNQTFSQAYINIHTAQNPGGEIRGQVPLLIYTPIWCPWGPTWWPGLRWTRWGTTWGLTVYHPYCYRWNPNYVPQPWCLYGLRYFYTPIGDVRQPAQDPAHPNAVPLQNNLSVAALANRPWSIYNSVLYQGAVLRPLYHYWPYVPYCSRWYWFRCLPFSLYRYNPPVVQAAIWQGPAPTQDFPDSPIEEVPGTVAIITTRAQVSQPGDNNGDGNVNIADLANYRQQAGTPPAIDSFFDVFTEIE